MNQITIDWKEMSNIRDGIIEKLNTEISRLHKEANINMKELCRVRGQLAKLRAAIIKRAGK